MKQKHESREPMHISWIDPLWWVKGRENQRGLGLDKPKEAQWCIDVREMDTNQAPWAKEQSIWPEKDLSKCKLPYGISRRLAWGRFVPWTQIEEEGELKNMDGQLKTCKLLIGYYLTKEQ